MMDGGLALASGVLFVARSGAARVVPHDLEGRPLGPGFAIDGLDGRRATIGALACDVDRRLWTVDPGARALRGFSVFGSEVFRWQADAPDRDRAAHLGRPVGVAVGGVEAETRLVVASAGERRHALHWIDPLAREALSLRPLGAPAGRFRHLAGVALAGRFAYACETGAARVQVFRDGEFHFAFGAPPAPGGAPFEPRAIAVLPDGRIVVAHAGETSALLLFEPGGRFLRVLVGDGPEPGAVLEPVALAADGERLWVLDRGGDRLQAFDPGGEHLGAPRNAAPDGG
jgi:hypothetical protein